MKAVVTPAERTARRSYRDIMKSALRTNQKKANELLAVSQCVGWMRSWPTIPPVLGLYASMSCWRTCSRTSKLLIDGPSHGMVLTFVHCSQEGSSLCVCV